MLTEKEEAIRKVLYKRIDAAKGFSPKVQNEKHKEYLTGKIHGYEQAIDLLGSSLECINIEL